ncbi:MAG: hypothetical protein HRU69_03825 [Flammeovirgaceae bacterium]|nr:MAG: hypothetical protein HRU69_03825 [Flammeovirgaceae bacterium]
MMKPFTLPALSIVMLSSCATLTDSPKYQLSNGHYDFRQQGNKYTKVFVEVTDDSVKIYPSNGETISIIPSKDEFFRTKNFDLDVTTIGFRYRPATQNLPRQLNANFNGNLYFGYRIDRFQIDFLETPAGIKKIHRHRAFTIGAFGGMGSTFVSPWTTNNQTTDEYDGFILSRGFAAMAGINNLTVGVALGWDYLTDRDQDVWIYQNKPWLGLMIGLNIN